MKSKTFKKIFGSVFLVIILYFLFGGDYNIYNLWKYRQKEKDLRSEIQTIDKEKEQLITEIEMLKNDSTYIEKIAREEFKMGKPNEKIYIVKSKDDK
ncbi:septum formation initiator family protein [candidate division KSB1 bacterium]|nr:septum formation initiator family protein [candidate division KSB1 bacterium]